MVQLNVVDVRSRMPNASNYPQMRRSHEIRGVAIHHSATAHLRTGKSSGDAKVFFQYHVRQLGWDHGGYHYVILPNGTIQYALDEQIPAFHAGFHDDQDNPETENGQIWNNHYLAVCLVGWFEENRTITDAHGKVHHLPNRWTEPTSKQMGALYTLILSLRERYGFPLENVLGHRELKGSNTVCPGPKFDLDHLHRQLAIMLSNTPVAEIRLLKYRKSFLKRRRAKNAASRPIVVPVLISAGNQITRMIGWFSLFLPGAGILWLALLSNSPWIKLFLSALFLVTLCPAGLILLRFYNPPVSAYMLRVKSDLRKAGEMPILAHHWAPYNSIPKHLMKAVVIHEDPTFFSHVGFAWEGIYRAWRSNAAGLPLRGGSSITQQLVKNLFLWPKPTPVRKLLEAWITIWMECLLPKRRLLELYVNLIQFDLRIFGVQAAAMHYFGKPLEAIDLQESIKLASIIPNPINFRLDSPSPFLRARQERILLRLEKTPESYWKHLG